MSLMSLLTLRPGQWAESGSPELFLFEKQIIHEINNPISSGAKMNYIRLDELLRVHEWLFCQECH